MAYIRYLAVVTVVWICLDRAAHLQKWIHLVIWNILAVSTFSIMLLKHRHCFNGKITYLRFNHDNNLYKEHWFGWFDILFQFCMVMVTTCKLVRISEPYTWEALFMQMWSILQRLWDRYDNLYATVCVCACILILLEKCEHKCNGGSCSF